MSDDDTPRTDPGEKDKSTDTDKRVVQMKGRAAAGDGKRHQVTLKRRHRHAGRVREAGETIEVSTRQRDWLAQRGIV